ncbi:unnamed protein product [Citrullus colocynthis]|uniref:Uncharacterized protein n=1 Tax=Citrullus colocynthis TaxID=252529 RepID=A0ABP0YN15_9ROSI
MKVQKKIQKLKTRLKAMNDHENLPFRLSHLGIFLCLSSVTFISFTVQGPFALVLAVIFSSIQNSLAFPYPLLSHLFLPLYIQLFNIIPLCSSSWSTHQRCFPLAHSLKLPQSPPKISPQNAQEFRDTNPPLLCRNGVLLSLKIIKRGKT